jgi:mannose-6-phosphate isomerase-like protein (cupin superfamily)
MAKQKWTPDDKFLLRQRQPGRDRVDDVLRRNKLSLDVDHVITSRDPGWAQARYELRRENMPPGWDTWQLPFYLIGQLSFFFLTSAAPGAILPAHTHEVAQVRIVLSGGLIHEDTELRSGDWMYIPPKVEYTLTASLNPGGCVHCYAY